MVRVGFHTRAQHTSGHPILGPSRIGFNHNPLQPYAERTPQDTFLMGTVSGAGTQLSRTHLLDGI